MHSLADFDRSVSPEHVWVLERDGAWVAAVQAEPRRHELVDLGTGGWLERLLPFIPVLNTMVDLRDYRMQWLQHLWFADGQAAASHALLEGVLHASEHRIGTLLFDRSCPVYDAWRKGGSIGLLGPFRHGFQAMARLIDVAPPRGPLVSTMRGQ